MNTQTITGRFPDLQSAERAIRQLLDAHVPSESITILARAEGQTIERPLEHETGVVPGGIVGGTIGTIAGLLGAVVVAGPVGLAPALVVVVGGSTGGFGGALVGLSWWRKTARHLGNEMDEGTAVWVAVQHETMTEPAGRILEAAGAQAVHIPFDRVDESSDESFPASDPPSWTPGHA